MTDVQDIFEEELKGKTQETPDTQVISEETEETQEAARDIQDEEESIQEAVEEEDTKKTEKKFFQKKTDKKMAALEEKVVQLEDQTKRQMAEFDNFRKRTEKEKSQMFETGAKSVIEKILPVIDNFERGLAAVGEDNKDAFYDGMCMIHKQMMAELEKIGVVPIEALGKEFDPNLHNAVMQVESEEFESGFVAQELQKGYQYRDTVVRHSMVAVVQ